MERTNITRPDLGLLMAKLYPNLTDEEYVCKEEEDGVWLYVAPGVTPPTLAELEQEANRIASLRTQAQNAQAAKLEARAAKLAALTAAKDSLDKATTVAGVKTAAAAAIAALEARLAALEGR